MPRKFVMHQIGFNGTNVMHMTENEPGYSLIIQFIIRKLAKNVFTYYLLYCFSLTVKVLCFSFSAKNPFHQFF